MPRWIEKPIITQPEDPTIRHIALTQGYVTIVDAADYEWLNSLNWHAAIRNDGKSIARHIVHKAMHRFLLGLSDPKVVADHINRNSLDNRRSNLRIADAAQNAMNRTVRSTSKSPYKGVSKARNHWRVSIQKAGKPTHIGMFDCPIEAAKAYDKKALELFGEFAVLNFP